MKRTSFSTPSQRSFEIHHVRRTATADKPKDLVALAEQKLRQIRAILAGNTGNQCTLHVRCLFLANEIKLEGLMQLDFVPQASTSPLNRGFGKSQVHNPLTVG